LQDPRLAESFDIGTVRVVPTRVRRPVASSERASDGEGSRMAIDPGVEQPARQMLDHAILHESEDLAALIRSVGDTTFAAVIDLCVLAAGYIAIDACGMRWPTKEMLNGIAQRAAHSVARPGVSEEEIFALLSRVAFSAEKPDDIVTARGAGPAPLLATASLLLAFCPQGMHWGQYLDQIWNAYDAADVIDKSVLPALMFQARTATSG
jgi:hypothetical protein